VGFDLRYRVVARGAKHVKDLDSVCVCWANQCGWRVSNSATCPALIVVSLLRVHQP
jgi:hypothetical protein